MTRVEYTQGLRTKSEPFLDVCAWGAVGDGVTDDTAAIQAAIDSIINTNGGGTLLIPAGKFRITSTIYVTSLTVLDSIGPPIGTGLVNLIGVSARDSQIYVDHNGIGIHCHKDSGTGGYNGEPKIESIHFIGNSQPAGSIGVGLGAAGDTGTNLGGAKVVNCVFSNLDTGMQLFRCPNSTILGCVFQHNNNGLIIGNETKAVNNTSALTLLNNKLDHNDEIGLTIFIGNHIKIIGGTIQGNGDEGAKVYETSTPSSVGNIVFDNVWFEANQANVPGTSQGQVLIDAAVGKKVTGVYFNNCRFEQNATQSDYLIRVGRGSGIHFNCCQVDTAGDKVGYATTGSEWFYIRGRTREDVANITNYIDGTVNTDFAPSIGVCFADTGVNDKLDGTVSGFAQAQGSMNSRFSSKTIDFATTFEGLAIATGVTDSGSQYGHNVNGTEFEVYVPQYAIPVAMSVYLSQAVAASTVFSLYNSRISTMSNVINVTLASGNKGFNTFAIADFTGGSDYAANVNDVWQVEWNGNMNAMSPTNMQVTVYWRYHGVDAY